MMTVMIMLLWGMDVFVLGPRWASVMNDRAFMKGRLLFLISCAGGIALAVSSGQEAFRVLSALLFVLLGIFILGRLRRENRIARHIYYADRSLIRDGVLFIFIGTLLKWFWGMICLSAGIHLACYFLSPQGTDDLLPLSLLSLGASLWMAALIWMFQRRCPVYSWRELTGLTPARGSVWKRLILPLAAGSGIALVSGFLLVNYFDHAVTPFSELIDWAEPSWMLGVFLAVALVAAPFLEEMIFRGFFFRVLSDGLGRAWAFWLVGLSFGLLHMDQYWGNGAAIGMVVLLGLLMTWQRMACGSAKPSMIMHYTFNIMMMITPAVFFTMARPVFMEYSMTRDGLSFTQKQAMLQESIREDAGNALAYYEMALLYLETGTALDEALVSADKALALVPDRTVFQHVRARTLLALGRRDEAVRVWESLADALPGNAQISASLRQAREKPPEESVPESDEP